MNLKALRNKFSIFLFFPSSDENKEMKGAFVEAGYESFVFADQDLLVQRIKEAAPHVILFSPEALETPLSDFVSQVLESNSEVQFVCVAPAAQSETLNEYREYNFSAVVPRAEQLPLRAVWAVDQVCENIYRTYQNEELLTRSENLQTQVQQLQQQLGTLQSQKAQIKEISLESRLAMYQGSQSKDEILNVFLQHLPCHAIFFKYLPTVNSFVATFSQKLEIETIKGVGSRLTSQESENLQQDLSEQKLPRALSRLMSEGLKVPAYFFRAVRVHQNLDGLIIFWGAEYSEIENDFLVFQLMYQQAYLIKRNESVEVFDPVTELFNRNYYLQKLDEEIHRARRLARAVSVVTLSVDHLTEIEQSFGRNNRDLILRTIASIIKKTSRVNDLSCRTEDNEFSLILPHCARKGAALRAERLRRIIEGHAFAVSDLKVTISCGVSEYPSLSKGASDLEASAGKALEFIASRGGNKVCLFKPEQEFKPDFEVPPM